VISIRRILSDYRTTGITLGLLAILVAGGYVLFLYPLKARVASTERRAVAASTALRAAAQQDLGVRRLVTGKQQAASDLERFYTEILPPNRAAARRITYVQMAELAEDCNLDLTRRTAEVVEDRGGQLARMTVTMTLRGEYGDIRRFIHRVETSASFVVVSGLELAQRDSTDNLLEVALQLTTYYRVADGG
jgi:Tfp pilus assembly protein PilO